MRKSLWIILAVLLVVIAAPSARADIVTLDVSGSLTPGGGASCSSSGCTLGGDIVINNTTGAVISTDVTFSGESPSVGPFDGVNQVVADGDQTGLGIADSTGSSSLILAFSTITPGSLVGYSGGPLAFGEVSTKSGCCAWLLNSGGALTEAVAAPEPSSYALMLLGVGLVFVMRKRIGQGLPQAS
jgi:hypothetical protein